MAGERFAASYDLTTKVVSSVICGALLTISVFAQNLPIAFLGFLIIACGYAYSPRAYEFLEGAVTVKRLTGAARVSLEGLREARRTSPEDLLGCIRLWGSGGFFGYYGLFRTSKLGKSTWYVTNRKNMVVVVTANKTTLFSPDNVDGFLVAILGSAGSGSSGGIGGVGSGSAGSGSSGLGEG